MSQVGSVAMTFLPLWLPGRVIPSRLARAKPTRTRSQVAPAPALAQLNEAGVYDRPIATKLSALDAFYPAEDYHQDYATLHPDSAYIARFDLPKIQNLERIFPGNYRAEPELVNVSARS